MWLGWAWRRRRRRGGGDCNAEASPATEYHLFSSDGDILQVRRERNPPRAEAAPRRRMALHRLYLRHVRESPVDHGPPRANHVLPVFLRLSFGLSDEDEPLDGDSKRHHYVHI